MLIDSRKVRLEYQDAGYTGIVDFLDFLATHYQEGKEVLEVICSNVCFDVCPYELSAAERQQLPDYHIGSRELGILPFEAFATVPIHSRSHDELACLNAVCKDIVYPYNFCPVSFAITIGYRYMVRH